MKKIIIANWKMNPTDLREVKRILKPFKKQYKDLEIIVCPPFVYLERVKPLGKFKLGAQDCFYKEKGPFTGEISPLMLKSLKVEYVIIGHPERKENEEIIILKLKSALKAGLKPIICFKKEPFKELGDRAKKILKAIPRSQINNIIINYESEGCPASKVVTVVLFIRKIIASLFGVKNAKQVKILYGGGLNSKNIDEYFKEDEINGFVLGRSSLDPKELMRIIKR